MLAKISLGLLVVIVAFLGYVATRPSHFNYVRAGVINAPAEKIYPYLTDFRRGAEWSPYEKKDPNMKKQFAGADGQVGSVMEFDGNSEAGSGKLELVKVVPNELAHIRLLMTKPMTTDNLIEYKLTPEGAGTRFTWTMSGDAGFLGKLVAVLIDCEKMVAGDFEKGIANLKALVEAQASGARAL